MDSLTTTLQIYIHMTKRQWQLSILLFRVRAPAPGTTVLQLLMYMLVMAIHILEQVQNRLPICNNIYSGIGAYVVVKPLL